jgi:hypothetical protein
MSINQIKQSWIQSEMVNPIQDSHEKIIEHPEIMNLIELRIHKDNYKQIIQLADYLCRLYIKNI